MPTTERLLRPDSTGLLGWFYNLFRRPMYWALNLGTREVVSDIDQHRAIEQGFNANTAVYAIIKDDAEKFASIPRFVYDAKSIEAKNNRRMPTHLKAVSGAKTLQNDLSKLLARPNPYQGQAAFLKMVRAYYKDCGEAFIWLNRGDMSGLNDMAQDRKPVLEMYPLPVDQMEVVPDPENLFGVTGYILKASGNSIPIRKQDIIHWKDLNLSFDASSKVHLRGMTPFKPGGLTLQQDNEIGRSATRMYQNDGAKGILYGEETKALSPTQQSDIRGVVDKKINNNDIKGAVASIFGAGKLGYFDIGQSSVDMNLLEGKKVTLQELCMLLGVPVEMYQTGTTFSNKEQAQENWVSNKMMPACKEFDDEINRGLLRAFGLEGRAIIASDFSELPELQENMKELADWLDKAIWLTMNEKREVMGYEKYSDATFDEPWMPSTLTPVSKLEEPDDGLDDDALSDYAVGPRAQQQEAKPVAA